jgi:hypothetical protein
MGKRIPSCVYIKQGFFLGLDGEGLKAGLFLNTVGVAWTDTPPLLKNTHPLPPLFRGEKKDTSFHFPL